MDVPLLVNQLQGSGKLEEVGGSLYILDLADNAYSAAKIRDYLSVIIREYAVRRIAAVAEQAAVEARSALAKPEELVSRLEEAISDVRRCTSEVWPHDSSTVMRQTIGFLEDRRRNIQSMLRTGFDELDWYVRSFERGQLILLGGRPSMGKTSLALDICENVARSGHKVGIVSLEMPNAELGTRLLSKRTRIPVADLLGGDDLGEGWTNVIDAAANVAEFPLIFSAGSHSLRSLDKVLGEIHRLVCDCKCELVMLDYLGLISPGNKLPASQTQWIGHVSQSLKLTARELNVPILCLSQLNRAAETRPDPRPQLSDLRDSGSLEQDADIVMLCYRPWYYVTDSGDDKQKNLRTMTVEVAKRRVERKTENLCEVIVAKNRNGATGSCWLSWRAEYCAFENLSLDEPETIF